MTRIPVTSEQRAEIKRLREENYKHEDIAKITGRPMGTIATVLADGKYNREPADDFKSTTLYRHYDEYNQLLYVGISYTVFLRTVHHSRTTSWWREVKYIVLQHFSSRKEARRAEKLAVETEEPLYNSHFSRL